MIPLERESSRDFKLDDCDKFNAYEFMQSLDKSCFNYFALSKKINKGDKFIKKKEDDEKEFLHFMLPERC